MLPNYSLSPAEMVERGYATSKTASALGCHGKTVKEIKPTFPQGWQILGYDDYSNEESRKAFREWCVKHDVHYFAAPREDFHPDAFRRAAIEKNATWILMEDMS